MPRAQRAASAQFVTRGTLRVKQRARMHEAVEKRLRRLGSWAAGTVTVSCVASAKLVSRPVDSLRAAWAGSDAGAVATAWRAQSAGRRAAGRRRCLCPAEGCTVASPRAPHPHHAGRYAHSSDHREGWTKDQSTTYATTDSRTYGWHRLWLTLAHVGVAIISLQVTAIPELFKLSI